MLGILLTYWNIFVSVILKTNIKKEIFSFFESKYIIFYKRVKIFELDYFNKYFNPSKL